MSGCAQARGYPNIYNFLRNTNYAPEPPDFAAQLASATDRTPLIVKAALEDSAAHSLCAATLQIFVTILGSEAGNLALKTLATSGLFWLEESPSGSFLSWKMAGSCRPLWTKGGLPAC